MARYQQPATTSASGIVADIDIHFESSVAMPVTRNVLRGFLIDFKPGWSAAPGFRGDAVKDAPSTGTHGYLPDHLELRSTFMVMGFGVAKGRNLDVIDMRQIAPLVAAMLGVNYRPLNCNPSTTSLSIYTSKPPCRPRPH